MAAAIPECNGFPGTEISEYEGETYLYVRWESVYGEQYKVRELMRPSNFIHYYKSYTSIYPDDLAGATIHCAETPSRNKCGQIPLGDYGARPRALFGLLGCLMSKRRLDAKRKLYPLFLGLVGIMLAKLTGKLAEM